MKKELMSCKTNCYLILAFMLSLIPRLYIAADTLTVRHVSDNVALLSSPAYIAGYNWSEVVSNAGYYGFGFYALFFWLFRITDNPIVIYRIFTIIGAFVQALVAPACYYFLVHCLKFGEEKKAFLLSVISSYFVAVSASTVYNEIPFSLLIWLIAIILCKIIDSDSNKKRKFLWSFFLVLLLMYSLTIHTRTWSVIIAVILAMTVYGLLYRKMLISIAIIPVVGILYFIVQKSIQYMQNILWNAGNGDTLKNASINIGQPEIERLSSICKILFGQVNSFMIFSIGTLGLAILGILFYWGQRWYSRYKKIDLLDANELELEKKSILVGLTMLIAFGGTIVAQSISWSYAMNAGDEYSYKACFYLRYAIPFAGVIFVLGMRLFLAKQCKFKHILIFLFLITFLLSVYLFIYIFPNVAELEVCGTAGMGAALGYISFKAVNISNYLKMFLIYWVLFCLVILLLLYKKDMLMLSIVCLILMYQYHYNDKYVDKPVEQDNYTVVNASYQWVEELKKDGIEIPNTLYVVDCTNQTDHNNYYLFQLFFFNKTVIPAIPEDGVDDVLLFSNSRIDDMETYEMLRLDKNEYVYLKGKYVNLLYKK